MGPTPLLGIELREYQHKRPGSGHVASDVCERLGCFDLAP